MKTRISAYFILFAFSGISLISCSNDEDTKDTHQEVPTEINPMDAYTPLIKTSKPNNELLLGRGYDYTGTYATHTSVKEAVIDLNKLLTDQPYDYYPKINTINSSYFIIEADAQHYTKRLTAKASNHKWDSPPIEMSAFSGAILDNQMLFNKDINLKDFSFASAHYYYYRNEHNLLTSTSELQNYLSKSFNDDLISLPIDNIIKKYGTHLITSYTMGLRLDMIYRSKIDITNYIMPGSEDDGQYFKKNFVEAGLRHTINSIGYWGIGEIRPDPTDKDVKMNGIPVLYMENHGGDNKFIPSGIYNLQKGYPKINIYEWFNSMTEENTTLVDLNLEWAIPIYELIKDETKKEELKVGIEEYIKARQIKF